MTYRILFVFPFLREAHRLQIFFAKLLFVGALTGMPQVLYAGMFPLFFSWFGGTDPVIYEESPSPYFERMDGLLLHAALNLDPNPSKGGGDIVIEDETALRSEGGPSGTMANIEDQKPSDHISIYVVREGDSLAGIAKMFGVSPNTIVWANDIRGGALKVGTVLTILPVTGVKHTVAKGDTLQSIAKKYKGDLDEILQFNNLARNAQIAVGETVIIPDGELGAPKPATTRTTTIKGSTAPSYEGYYIKPIVGGRKTQGIHGYNGIDFGAPVGTPIVASAPGIVIISKTGGWNGGYGNYVVIRHDNGTQSLYAHNTSNAVAVGESVVQGQVIGYVGSTGRSTGPHVHFEIRGAKNPF